jgi:hypothetical protein
MTDYDPFKDPVPQPKPREDILAWEMVKDVPNHDRLTAHRGQ